MNEDQDEPKYSVAGNIFSALTFIVVFGSIISIMAFETMPDKAAANGAALAKETAVRVTNSSITGNILYGFAGGIVIFTILSMFKNDIFNKPE